MIPLLKDKRILLGITGGIAAYKICTLASHLTQAGAQVDVVMTEAATRFVAPLTFEALTGRAVYTTMWPTSEPGHGEAEGQSRDLSEATSTHISHVRLAHSADALVIAPATANTMAKLAHGVADNLLTAVALAATCPMLLVPAMDVAMWANPATQANVATLRERGVRFAGPVRGRMASGLHGEGRMMEPGELLGHVRRALGLRGPLAGRRIVVTAGPTREALDPVRFISNPSSGRQGFALAQAALDRGADVTLITGPTHLPTPAGAQRVDVATARALHDAVIPAVQRADVLLMAAAVGDYRPASVAPHKLKKSDGDLNLRLARTRDILSAVALQWAETRHPHIVLGFAAESEDVLKNARLKLASKNLDMIVANDITASDAGFGAETNRVVILDREGGVEKLPLMSKAAVAEAVLERVEDLLHRKEEARSKK